VTEQVYIQSSRDQAKREALAAWNRYISELVSGREASNVIELRA
jgi:hypothetical protein